MFAFLNLKAIVLEIIENRIIGAEFSRLCASIIFAYNNDLTIVRKAFRWFIPLYWDRVSHYRRLNVEEYFLHENCLGEQERFES